MKWNYREKIENCRATAHGFLQFSHALKAIHLHIDMIAQDIPQWLQRKASQFHNFQLQRCLDSGPATHMHQVLRMERNPKTYILQAGMKARKLAILEAYGCIWKLDNEEFNER